MTQEEDKRFGTLPEELVVKVVELVDSTDILALRGVSKLMKRLTYDRFVVEFFADIRQDISSRALATLGDITSHEHICKEIKSTSFGSSIESVAGTGQEAQEVWLKYLMTEVLQNLKDAGKSVFLGTHTNISESPDDDRADAMIRHAIDETGLIVKGITLEDDLGDYLALLEIRPAANSSSSSHQAGTSSSQAEMSSSTDPSVAATTEPVVKATQVTTTRAVWKTKLPLDRFPREVAYTDTTGTLLVKCSNCTVESFPPLPLGLCTCLLANLDELNFTGRFSDKPMRTLRLEDCAAEPDEIIDILQNNRTTIESVEFINLHLRSEGDWKNLPELLKELSLLRLKRLTLSDVVRDSNSDRPMTSIVVIQEGATEVFTDQQAISDALDRWIQARPQ